MNALKEMLSLKLRQTLIWSRHTHYILNFWKHVFWISELLLLKLALTLLSLTVTVHCIESLCDNRGLSAVRVHLTDSLIAWGY